MKSTMARQHVDSQIAAIQKAQSASAAAWTPLRHPLFRALWMASIASSIGTWMHEAGAGWLMTSLTTSPLMVALMQTASSLPIFLLGLPAGALADVVDRRRMLLFTQGWMLIAAGALGVLTLLDETTPWILLALALALGAGAAMNAPVWQATAPELLPRSELPKAVALNGVGLNLARAIGPALGGAVVTAAGPGAVFFLNAVSFLAVIAVLCRWHRARPVGKAPVEPVLSAIRAGIRYARHAPALRAVLARTGLFVLFASALWALLPVLARHEMGVDSTAYGILFGCLGAGAVAGALVLPGLRRRFSMDGLSIVATAIFAAATAALTQVRQFGYLCAVLCVGGIAWITLVASFNIATQTAVPSWVRARALAMYLLVFQGSMAVGGVLWGMVAQHAGMTVALLAAATGLVLGLAGARRYRLMPGQESELRPSPHWPEPNVVIEPDPDDGPVLVTVEYRIDPKQARDFAGAMQSVRRQRLRDGAFRSGLYRDPGDPGRYLETFVVESWAEHLRQHERVTVGDRIAEERARAFHRGARPPVTSHYIYTRVSEPNDSGATEP